MSEEKKVKRGKYKITKNKKKLMRFLLLIEKIKVVKDENNIRK